jgi:hypothetical protein
MYTIFLGLFSIILIFNTSCSPNKIDLIKNDNDVFTFIQQFFATDRLDNSFEKYYNETIHVADSLRVKKWVKVDLDNNGETDLLIFRANGLPKVLAILSFKEKYFPVIANYHPCKYQFIYPITKLINKQNVILLYSQNQTGYNDLNQHFTYTGIICDTIIIRDSLFLNYTQKQRTFNIEKIEFKNDGMCEGNCPKINVSIDPNKFTSSCSKILYWDSNPTSYSGTLNKEQIEKIVTILNYSNFVDFKNEYEVGCTDQTTSTLTITYNNGNTKTIQDYGSSGNFTLKEIYNVLHSIEWK